MRLHPAEFQPQNHGKRFVSPLGLLKLAFWALIDGFVLFVIWIGRRNEIWCGSRDTVVNRRVFKAGNKITMFHAGRQWAEWGLQLEHNLVSASARLSATVLNLKLRVAPGTAPNSISWLRRMWDLKSWGKSAFRSPNAALMYRLSLPLRPYSLSGTALMRPTQQRD